MAKSGGGSRGGSVSKLLGISVGELRAQRRAERAVGALRSSTSFMLSDEQRRGFMRDVNSYVSKYVNKRG